MEETIDASRPWTRPGLLTLDELTARVGMSVRNIRFYTTRGLVPPPIRRGRSGYYTADHVARLELVQELQSHGFTLAAIEKYVAGIPADATPEDIALHRTMLAPVDGRAAGRAVPRRALPAGRPRARRVGPGHPGGPGHRRCPARGAATGSRSRSSPSASACSTSAIPSRRPGPPPRSTPRTDARSPRSSTSCSAPWSGRCTRSPGDSRTGSRRSWSVSSRSRSRRLVSAYEAAMDERKREGIARRSR